jgi:hypothetical protein
MAETSMESLFGSNPGKETEGVVIQYGTLRVRLARAGGANKQFAKVLEEERRPYARLITNDILPDDLARDMMYRTYAKTIVLEWSGMVYGGAEVPFTVDNCIKMFNEMPEFFQFVFEESKRLSNFRDREAEVKNL